MSANTTTTAVQVYFFFNLPVFMYNDFAIFKELQKYKNIEYNQTLLFFSQSHEQPAKQYCPRK